MNYIFDVYINFNKELFSFYDWNSEDNIEYFLRIPIIKVEDEVVNNFIIHDIKVNSFFLKKIYNKSQKYYKNVVKNNNYSCIISSNNKCIAINFDDNGNIDSRSYLSLEEESEIIEFSKFLKYNLIDYKIIKKNSIKTNYLTRKERDLINKLTMYLKGLCDNKKYEELEYIYYELYNSKTDKIDIIKQKLFNAINNSDTKRNELLKLYNFVYN